MITEISLSNVHSYAKPVKIENLAKVNFFFGSNGSGKSTIAKYLNNTSIPTDERSCSFNSCSIKTSNSDPNELLVFDEKFVEKNFKRSSEFPGVFTLDKKNSDIDKQINQHQIKLEFYSDFENLYNSRSARIKNYLSKAEDTLKESCWDQRKLFEAFHELKLEHSNSKKNHYKELYRLSESVTTTKNIKELSSTYHKLFTEDREEIENEISLEILNELEDLESEASKLLIEVIDTNKNVDVAKLIDVLGIRTWVDEGRNYVVEGKENICPFCQKPTFDDELKTKFNNFFDQTYQDKLDRIKKIKQKYGDLSNQFLENIYELISNYNPENKVSDLHKFYKDLFNDNLDLIAQKIKSPNEKFELYDVTEKKTECEFINKAIQRNNKEIQNVEQHKEELEKDIWLYMARRSKDEIKNFNEDKQKANYIKNLIEERIKHIQSQKKNLINQISDLKDKTVKTDVAVKNINQILLNAGFNNFKIEEKTKENKISRYYLKRGEEDSKNVFETLSEGEKNFIAFLYFNELVLGTDDHKKRTRNKIVIIDDPVSSLDSRVLFIVSTLIHSLIEKSKDNSKALKNKNICQVFILTHNLYFYKEVAHDLRPICKNKKHYHVFKNPNNSEIKLKGDKVFRHNDYVLLWQSIKELKDSSDPTYNISICNSMRRIIESYVNFIGLGKNQWDSLKTIDVSDPIFPICSALISQINDSSHKFLPMDDLYFQRIVNEDPSNLYKAFQIIFDNIGKDHYSMMMN